MIHILTPSECLVRRQDSGAILNGLVVELPIVLTHLAPVAADVAVKEVCRRLAALLKGFEGSGRPDDLPEGKSWASGRI